MKNLSLRYPPDVPYRPKRLPQEASNDLAVDFICAEVAKQNAEQGMIKKMLTEIVSDQRTAEYRCGVFEDIYRFPKLCEKVQGLLEKIDFLRTYGSFKREHEEAASLWELIHRLNEVGDYIICIEELYDCLSKEELHSEGWQLLRDYVREIYEDGGFTYLKKDIEKLKKETEKIKSVTLGVNLNDRYEVNGVGIISINSKSFSKTGILSNFCDFLNRGDEIQDSIEVKQNAAIKMLREESNMAKKRAIKEIISVGPKEEASSGMMHALDKIVSSMLSATTKKLKRILSEHVEDSSYVIASLLPELLFYARFADYIKKQQAQGFLFCRPHVLDEKERAMQAKGFYNIRLIPAFLERGSEEIVRNDLDFDAEHRIYLLTGANRGGKTTVTQAVGMAFLLAQSGIFVPAEQFIFSPADNIYTHYPADENKTVDLGRLGEEAKRFKELYAEATNRSLILLNESFTSTSFEEGFYIAYDVVKALKLLGARTMFNTHMHKLAESAEQLNRELKSDSSAASLIMESENGRRSYKVCLAPPQGTSYAQDIARKYGVTFEQLCADQAKKEGH